MPDWRLPPIQGDSTMDGKVRFPHPGETLLHDSLEEMGITQYRLAKAIRVPQRRISQIVKGERAITADTALRLARFFGTTEGFWINLQANYDMAMARERLEHELERIQPCRAGA